MSDVLTRSRLAIDGGPQAVPDGAGDMFTWPIVTAEDEAAVLDVLHRGAMSALDVTREFETEYAAWQGSRYALAHSSGTTALQAAMFACRVGVGDEIICPSITYWASALPAFSLGATIVFADVDPHTLCLDPADIEHRITERTRAIVAVHYLGHPADMGPIMEIARRRGVKVIEDVSHAHGGLYQGRPVGTIGDVGAASLMTHKGLPAGEGGMLTTDNREVFERALAFGHYERFGATPASLPIETEDLRPFAGLPLGGLKNRMHQMSAAVGRVQLRHYPQRMAEIQRAMNHFWDLLEGVPGVRPHRPAPGSGSTMGGWYSPHGLYRPEELGGLSVTRYTQAVQAEGVSCSPGLNSPLHLHPLLNTADVYGHGRPTRIANAARDVRQPAGSLPVSEAAGGRAFRIPWFKHYRPQVIEAHAQAFRKVAEQAPMLLAGDPGDPSHLTGWRIYTPT
ncbi:MAG TPA: DegT/DnrJ/EryC1/StrS family aminotransferase [Chloroflexota bacterium]|nr:DegT/DnrJ/EryC1/StrS family aminotransferase [Chloroflexota bacterium]